MRALKVLAEMVGSPLTLLPLMEENDHLPFLTYDDDYSARNITAITQCKSGSARKGGLDNRLLG